MSLIEIQKQLLGTIRQSAPEAAIDWLNSALSRLRHNERVESDLLTFSAMARRKLGNDPLQTPGIETEAGTLDIAHWSLGDATRVVLLMEAVRLTPERPLKWIDALFRHGDESERAAVMQALSLFPSAASLKHIAQEVGRCNSLLLYSSMALKNPYIARFYDEHEFNQVVLKSLFTGLSIEHIEQLQQRANADLARMCEDYADERMAAGRDLPADIWLAIGPFASAHGKQLMQQFLQHDDPMHRHYTATAIGHRQLGDPELTEALIQQLKRETDPMVRDTLEKQLKKRQESQGSSR